MKAYFSITESTSEAGSPRCHASMTTRRVPGFFHSSVSSFCFLATPRGMWALSSRALAVESWILNHCTSREFPIFPFLASQLMVQDGSWKCSYHIYIPGSREEKERGTNRAWLLLSQLYFKKCLRCPAPLFPLHITGQLLATGYVYLQRRWGNIAF